MPILRRPNRHDKTVTFRRIAIVLRRTVLIESVTVGDSLWEC